MATFLLDKPRGLYLSPFRAFNKKIAKQIVEYKGPFVYLDGLILGVTRDIKTVSVIHHKRYAGSGNYGLIKSVSLLFKMATSFSIIPLRLTTFIGFLVAALGLTFAVILVIQKFVYNFMPVGWSSMIVTILILGGVQLIALGIIGEYLGRVLITINLKPQYIIKDITNDR
jgi:undecaprenyl-phosphate 4-deoxy-4-formamido-L-arabinose transferase